MLLAIKIGSGQVHTIFDLKTLFEFLLHLGDMFLCLCNIFSLCLYVLFKHTLTQANMDFFFTFKSPKNNSIKKRHNASIQSHLITRQVVEKHPRNDCSASGLVCPGCYQTKIEKRVVRRLSVSMGCLNTTQTISVFFPFYGGTLVFMD